MNICGTIDEPSRGDTGAPPGGPRACAQPCVCVCVHDATPAGELRLFGERVDFERDTDTHLAALRLAKIGFVFQTFNLLATLSAFENVELPMSILGCVARCYCAATAPLRNHRLAL